MVERLEQLDALIAQYRGRYRYDCLVPFSGGKDSTWTLYYLMKRYPGLKPLVVRFNHGFLRPTSRPIVIGYFASLVWMCMTSPLAGKWFSG